MSPCESFGSLDFEDSGSDPEYGIVEGQYTFHCNYEVNDSSYFFFHFLAAYEMALVRVQVDGACNTVREL